MGWSRGAASRKSSWATRNRDSPAWSCHPSPLTTPWAGSVEGSLSGGCQVLDTSCFSLQEITTCVFVPVMYLICWGFLWVLYFQTMHLSSRSCTVPEKCATRCFTGFSSLHSKLRQDHSFVLWSRGFYTSVFGYRLCLKARVSITAGSTVYCVLCTVYCVL